MFDDVLQLPCSYAMIARDEPSELRSDRNGDVAFVSWRETFEACDKSGSIRSIARLLKENCHLDRHRSD